MCPGGDVLTNSADITSNATDSVACAQADHEGGSNKDEDQFAHSGANYSCARERMSSPARVLATRGGLGCARERAAEGIYVFAESSDGIARTKGNGGEGGG
jgi:hypothetical protein